MLIISQEFYNFQLSIEFLAISYNFIHKAMELIPRINFQSVWLYLICKIISFYSCMWYKPRYQTSMQLFNDWCIRACMPPTWLITYWTLYDPDTPSVFLMICYHLMRSLTFLLGLISSKFSPSCLMSASRFAIALFRRPQLPRFLQVEKLLPSLVVKIKSNQLNK